MNTQITPNKTTQTPANVKMNSEHSDDHAETKSKSEFTMPSFAGVSLVEIAILGAGGYVLWKNRAKVQTILEKNGIEVPALIAGDFSELLRTGAKALAGKDGQEGSKKDDRTSTSSSSRLNG